MPPSLYRRRMVNWDFKTRGEALRYAFENDHPDVWGRLWYPYYKTTRERRRLTGRAFL